MLGRKEKKKKSSFLWKESWTRVDQSLSLILLTCSRLKIAESTALRELSSQE
jgi:hypothetical protein